MLYSTQRNAFSAYHLGVLCPNSKVISIHIKTDGNPMKYRPSLFPPEGLFDFTNAIPSV